MNGRNPYIPITQRVGNALINKPDKVLPMYLKVPYFVLGALPIGAAMIGGFAADEIHHAYEFGKLLIVGPRGGGRP